MVKIYINNNNKIRLKINLKGNRIEDNNYFIKFIKSIKFKFTKLDFVKFIINIIPKNDSKVFIIIIFKNNILLFIFNVKTIIFNKFLDFGYFNISNF